MTKTVRLILILLAVVAQVVAPASPVAADEGSTAVPGPRGDDCCPVDAPGAGEKPDGARDCCADGCDHCPLSCCGGSPGLIALAPGGTGRPGATRAPLPSSGASLTAADPRKIYHPPRI